MTDPIDVLVEAAERTSADADLEPDPVAAVQALVARDRRHRRTLRAAAAAALVVVSLAAAGAWVVTGDDGEEVDVRSPSTEPAPPATSRPTATVAGDDVLSPRAQVAMAWTGSEVVVWGGVALDDQAVRDDGAAYDPDTGAARALAPSPLPPATDLDRAPLAASTDAGVVVVRGPATAVWDPATDTWRRLDDAPEPVTDLVAIGGDRAVSASANAVLDAGSGAWTEADAPPVVLERPTTAWTGRELVVLGGPGTPFTSAALSILDPATGRWRESAAPPPRLHAEALSAAWDGERVAVVNYDMTAATYDPGTDTWTDLPDVPARFYEHVPSTVAAGGSVVVRMATALVVLDGDTWVPLPPTALPDDSSVAIDPTDAPGRLAFWSTVDAADATGVQVVGLSDLAATTAQRQVGVAAIALAPDDTVVEAAYDPGDDTGPVPPVQTVRLTVDAAEGGSCTVTSAYGGVRELDTTTAVREELPADDPATAQGGSPTRVWFHDAGGRTWETEITDSDLFRVVCDEPAAARRLAESVLAS